MSTFGQRLRAARLQRGLSQAQLAEAIGADFANIISKWERDVTLPSTAYCIALCRELDISADDLLDCHGKSLQLSAAQEQIARRYGQLDAHGRRMVDSVAKMELERMREEKAADGRIVKFRTKTVPFVSQKASAGRGMLLLPQEAQPEQIQILLTGKSRNADFVVAVRGDSMEPAYHDGDLLLVQQTQTLDPGELGIFSVDSEGYFKKLGTGQLESLNPAYDPVPFGEGDVHVFGRVLGTAERVPEAQ